MLKTDHLLGKKHVSPNKKKKNRRKSTFLKFGEDKFTTDDLLYAK